MGGRGRAWAGGLPKLTGFSPFTVVADVLCEFLEVAVHLILYVREVYPVGIFQKRKKYNVPVQVSPHLWSSPNFKVGRGWIFELFLRFQAEPPHSPAAWPCRSVPSHNCRDFSFHPSELGVPLAPS